MSDRTHAELVETTPRMPDESMAVALSKAEIDQQIATARAYPRNLKRVIASITSLVTLDEETAQECLYALVRRKSDEENKPIEGPSIRLAEVAAQMYGNCRMDARVVHVDRTEKFVEAEGLFHDLETNMASRATVRRRISTKQGRLFSDDMIVVTGNAACAIAKRNAILAGIPRGIYRPAYQAARAIVAGTAETLGKNREKAIRAFASFGVTPAQLFEALAVQSEVDIKIDHVAQLRAMYSTLKNGEATVEEMFPAEAKPQAAAKPAPPQTKATEAPAAKQEQSAPAAADDLPPDPDAG